MRLRQRRPPKVRRRESSERSLPAHSRSIDHLNLFPLERVQFDHTQVDVIVVDCQSVGESDFTTSARAWTKQWLGSTWRRALTYRASCAVNQKREPCPGVLSTPMRPPMRSTSCRQMASPRPAPPYFRVIESSAWT